MVRDEITILCTGDIHLGRHSSRIPKDLDSPEFSPTAVWRDIVREAIKRDVDAVAISGDVADRENKYFEAYGAFEDGAARLDAADIPVVAVAGNHDFDVFPRIQRDLELESLHLLGEDGTWDYWTLERDGQPLVRFDGWSFPDEHVYESPLESYDLPDSNVPRIGVLHADLGSRESPYAPVELADLREKPVMAWLLGHIHRPSIPNKSNPLVCYPGSPQALDPGESGPHGPWLLSIDSNDQPAVERIPLSTVRYDTLEIDVSGIEDPKAAMPKISDRLREHVESLSGHGSLELILPCIRLMGRTEAHADLVDRSDAIREQLGTRAGSADVRIEAVEVDTRPEVDLEERATGDDAVAAVAKLLIELKNGELSDENERLLGESLDAMRQAHNASAYTVLRQETDIDRPDRDDAIETLETQARLVLDTLLEQTEAEA
ncbi:metallophosphoesterase family protein [Natrarchaeobius chitinivorans]|uniref:DNA repair exonuclease n=1 Tax=Natrarchaeobius chitinivorans TaxID=1679083 RepID=A0A3N6P891_NATCH|nr:DNA repair exonuclease [Natrarchaeobius chitinivorans]RQG94819.1 DNA repair exonuclease [Natrarchaeobius chitinivorans]